MVMNYRLIAYTYNTLAVFISRLYYCVFFQRDSDDGMFNLFQNQHTDLLACKCQKTGFAF